MSSSMPYFQQEFSYIAFEVKAWMINYRSYFYIDLIIYPNPRFSIDVASLWK